MWREEQRAGLNLKGRVFQLRLYVQTRSVHHPSIAPSSSSAAAARSPAPHLLQRSLLPALVSVPAPPHHHHIPTIPPLLPRPRASQGSVVLSILPTFTPPLEVSVPLGVSAWGMGVQGEVGERDRGRPLLSHQAVVHTSSRGPELPGQLGGVCGGKQMCPEPPLSSTPGRPRQHCPPAPSHVLALRGLSQRPVRAAGTPLSPPQPVAFCAKGKINNHQGRGGQGQGFEFLEMKFPYGEKGPTPITSCAWWLSFCGMLAKDSREGEGLGNDRAGRVLRKDGASRNCGGISGAGRVRQGRCITLSLAAGKTLSLDTRVPELGWEL